MARRLVVGLVFAASALLFAAEPASTTLPADHAERMTRGLQTFQKDIRPLLSQTCLKCHGGEKTKGGLDLSSRDELLKGGADGPVVVPFNSAESRLVRLIRHAEEPHMPHEQPKLSDETVTRVAAWIDDGAPYDQSLVDGKNAGKNRSVITAEDRKWWAFQPLAKVQLPSPGPDVPPNPLDRFILAKAAPKGLGLAPAAERRILIRRAYLDLVGVPPEPAAIDDFLQDKSADAWPRLIDRLLASPRYGERWARHWLDVARFAESSGFEHDYDREGAFHYRDFVIRALNQDLPYDQFLRWQLAGDEFDPDNPLALTATGFLGAGVFPTQITANEVERTRYDALDDMLATTGSAFLGLTLGCARCHDHKYDPIPTEDYYRMLSTFTTTVRSVIDLDIDPAKTRELIQHWANDRSSMEKDLAAYESSLRPKFDEWLAAGAQLQEPAAWTLLDLTNLVSMAGATFKKLDDGSYLAEGKNGDEDDYTFTGPAPARRLTGVRLDALSHPSMKSGGPGRADNGNIGLSRIRIYLIPPGEAPRELRIKKVEADFEQNHDNLSIASALDDNAHTGWAVDPQFGKDHSAVFTLGEPVDPPPGSTLSVKLEFHLNTRHNIGRPRISTTSEPQPSLGGQLFLPRIADLLLSVRAPGGAASISAEDKSAIYDWWKRRDDGWRDRNEHLAALIKKKPDGRSKVLVCAEGFPALRMHTQGADFFNETYILRRGNSDLKNGVANQSFLQVLMPSADSAKRWQWQPPSGAKFSGRRRSLATWLTDTDAGAGALAARVAVNRLWQHHFGRGIVATPNDFGKTGALPTHPEMLDWLATELIRNDWRLKPIHKLMMTSATYMQTTAVDATREAADPDNQLFVRRIPQRLEGEAIRDSILAVSGAMDSAMYGSGTKDEHSRRRSIYFTVKRSELIGSMVAFDQPEPLVSQGFRPTTTVAPQALMLLNGPQVREWAERFGRRLTPWGGDYEPIQALVDDAYMFALGRKPSADESRDAVSFISTQTKSYAVDGQTAPRSRALADFCQVVFGLNEFIYQN